MSLLEQLRERRDVREAEAAQAEEAASAAAASAADRYAGLVTALAKEAKAPRGLGKPEAVEELLAELGQDQSRLERDVRELRSVLRRAAELDPAGFATSARLAWLERSLIAEAERLEREARELRDRASLREFGQELADPDAAVAHSRAVAGFLPKAPKVAAYHEARAELDQACDLLRLASTAHLELRTDFLPGPEASALVDAAAQKVAECWAEVVPLVRFIPPEDRSAPALPASTFNLYD